MKTNRTLRLLSLFGFLLLFAPFYDHCNGHRMKKAEVETEPVIDSTSVLIDSTVKVSTNKTNVENDIVGNSVYETPFLEKLYDLIDDDDSENAFEIAEMSVSCILDFDFNFNEFIDRIKKDGYGVLFFQIKNFSFILIILLTILIVILSFKNINRVHKLSKLNLVFLLITIICLFLEGLFETITQIKYGYYAFIIVQILLFFQSRKSLHETPL